MEFLVSTTLRNGFQASVYVLIQLDPILAVGDRPLHPLMFRFPAWWENLCCLECPGAILVWWIFSSLWFLQTLPHMHTVLVMHCPFAWVITSKSVLLGCSFSWASLGVFICRVLCSKFGCSLTGPVIHGASPSNPGLSTVFPVVTTLFMDVIQSFLEVTG